VIVLPTRSSKYYHKMDLIQSDVKVVIEAGAYDGEAVALSDEEAIHSCSTGLMVNPTFIIS